jgi:glycosyltransferase involved in cell wall biosynthesis
MDPQFSYQVDPKTKYPKMSESPLVSVLMTSYNRETFIREAIESVLASTYTNFELIIVDDVSKDSTLAIAREYAARDARIQVYRNERNLGDYPNRNRAAGYARGEFIMYVDSDDTIFPEGIQRCVEAMLSFPESSFGMYWPHPAEKPFMLPAEKTIHQHFFEKPLLIIGPGGTILRRTFFQQIGAYPEKYGPANDMYFNLKAACHSPLVLLPFEFVFYRRHEGQEINNPYGYLYNGYLYLMDAIAELPLPLSKKQLRWIGNKCKRRFLVNCVQFFLKTKDTKRTRELIRKTGFGIKESFEAIFN